MTRKTPGASLRSYQTIFTQVGIIITLLLFILLVRIELKAEVIDRSFPEPEFEPPIIINSTLSIPPEVPAPPKPMVTIEVPDSEPIDDYVDFPEFEFDTVFLTAPPKPKTTPEDEVVESYSVELLPSIIGGQQALYSKIEYPEMARKAGIEGRIIVGFIVTKEGEVENLEILRGLGSGLNEEVIRVMNEVKFTPGVQNGRLVAVKMVQTIHFKLNN